MTIQSTFAIIKPEAIEQKLIGKIITKIEDADLKITKMQMMQVSKELAETHYAKDDTWCAKIGGYTLQDYQKAGVDPVKEVGTDDPVKLGRFVQQRVVEHIMSAPVIIMELTGENAVDGYRTLCGATEPAKADPNSIRGMYSKDNNLDATLQKRPLLNLLHSSGNAEEAAAELKLWFK